MSTYAPAQRAYRRNAIMTASPGQLVVMLYDGAIRFLNQGAAAMTAGQVELAHNKLRRGEDIIQHLIDTLDLSQGDVAARLHANYVFYLRYLNQARIDQDPAKVEKISELLGQLRQSWATIAATPIAANGPQAA